MQYKNKTKIVYCYVITHNRLNNEWNLLADSDKSYYRSFCKQHRRISQIKWHLRIKNVTVGLHGIHLSLNSAHDIH